LLWSLGRLGACTRYWLAGISTRSLMILYSMVSCALVRRDSSVSHPKCSIMEDTLLVLWYRLVTYLAALLCTISSLETRSFVYGFHTVEQYSRPGRTREVYAVVLTFSLLTRRLRWRKPSVLFPFFAVMSIWWFHERFWDRVTPRYLVVEDVVFKGVTEHDWVPLSVDTENAALLWVKVHTPLFLPFG